MLLAQFGLTYDLALRSSTTADPIHLTVADVADVQRTSPELLEKYGSISLPPIAENVQPSHVLLALSRAGVDLASIRLLTATDVHVASHGITDVVSMVRKTAAEKVKGLQKDKNTDFTLELTGVPENLPDVHAFSKLEVELKSDQPELAAKNMLIKFLDVQGRVLTTAIFQGEIKIQKIVVVAKRSLLAGEWATADDFVESKQVMADDNSEDYARSLADLGDTRWQISDPLTEGAPLKRSQLSYASVIKKGALVTLLTGDGRFQVRTQGIVKEVKEDGRTVLVENIDSKKELLGKPITPTEVKIAF